MRISITQSSKTLFKALFTSILITICLPGMSTVKAQEANSETSIRKLTDYPPYPRVEIETNLGNIYLELDAIRAPLTTHNFLRYIEAGHYDGTIFHRVIPGFVSQGGGFDTKFVERPTRDPVVNESGNGLSNLTGTIAMARTSDPHSGTSQFYINLVDNTKLDPRPDRWGYTVFGEVRTGMTLIQEQAGKKTGVGGSFSKDVPIDPFIVNTMRVMGADEDIPAEPVVTEEPPEEFPNEDEGEHSDEKKSPAEKAKAKLVE